MQLVMRLAIPQQDHDCQETDALYGFDHKANAVLADKTYDADERITKKAAKRLFLPEKSFASC